jgi:hypothetical protein
MATKWDGLVFAGMLMRSGFEVDQPHGYHLVTWGTLTPQGVVDELWKLQVRLGEDVKAHGLTLGEVIRAWDEMILGPDRP